LVGRRKDGIVRSILQELYVDHLVFRVRDLEATRAFYGALLGAPISQSESSLIYIVRETRLFFTLSVERITGPYDKEQPGSITLHSAFARLQHWENWSSI